MKKTFTATLRRRKVKRVQYDYRHTNGELFATVAPTLKECRERRGAWLIKNNF